MSWLMLCSGSATGVAQAYLLARSARLGMSVLSVYSRLGLVVLGLLLAARMGLLMVGALGWFAGFVLALVVLYRRGP